MICVYPASEIRSKRELSDSGCPIDDDIGDQAPFAYGCDMMRVVA